MPVGGEAAPTPETPLQAAEQAPPPAAANQPDPISAAAVALPPAAPVTMGADDAASTTSDTPAIADDADLIEKEWVLKAKQIVERTKEDPYDQNKQLNVFKADYMKKRYNKTIKLSE